MRIPALIVMDRRVRLARRTPIKFADKDSIVVAHFINTPGDTVMDDALDFPLNRELQESPYLTGGSVTYFAGIKHGSQSIDVFGPKKEIPNHVPLTSTGGWLFVAS